MIKLRLQRKGRKKRPYYHIVVADSRSPRDGRIIEQLGRFDNVSEKKELTYDEERVIHWLRIGAQPSNTVKNILQKEGILYKVHLMRWGKSEEEIEAALEEWRSERTAREADKDVSRKTQQKELLKAEEKEYKKQLEEKAAAAAKQLEKKKEEEAKAKAKAEAAEETEEAEQVEEVAETAEASEAETAPEEETEKAAAAEEVEEEVKAEEEVEEAVVEAEEPEAKAEETKKPEAEEETEPAEAQAQEEETAKEAESTEEPEEKAEATEAAVEEEETDTETAPEEEKEEKTSASVSTDMNANEAIDHIKNTPVDELEGFVPEEEERVTVQRAWEAKQAE